MNSLYLHKSPNAEELCIAVGNAKGKRRVWISDDEALKLAYRLMALARGGDTCGLEKQG